MDNRKTDQAERRKKLLWRAGHRGMKELDLVLGGFVASRIDALDDAGLDHVEQIINMDDTQLYDWIIGKVPLPDGIGNPLLKELLDVRFRPSDYSSARDQAS